MSKSQAAKDYPMYEGKVDKKLIQKAIAWIAKRTGKLSRFLASREGKR